MKKIICMLIITVFFQATVELSANKLILVSMSFDEHHP
jgi:hypothetical protein